MQEFGRREQASEAGICHYCKCSMVRVHLNTNTSSVSVGINSRIDLQLCGKGLLHVTWQLKYVTSFPEYVGALLY